MTLPPTKQASFATLCQIHRKNSCFDEKLPLESNVCSFSSAPHHPMGSDPIRSPNRSSSVTERCKVNDQEPKGSDPFLTKGVRPPCWSSC